MLTLIVVAASIYGIGLRADRIHAGRTVTEPTGVEGGRSHPGKVRTSVGTRARVGSVTVAVLYRGHGPRYWAMRYKRRTRQLQAARRALTTSLKRPVYGLSADERAFMCIHGFEGSWTDPNPPQWGGLQMDMDFQRTYAPWALAAFGTADHWPISVQIATAIRAKVSGRGFYPWPNTARYCGLIP